MFHDGSRQEGAAPILRRRSVHVALHQRKWLLMNLVVWHTNTQPQLTAEAKASMSSATELSSSQNRLHRHVFFIGSIRG